MVLDFHVPMTISVALGVFTVSWSDMSSTVHELSLSGRGRPPTGALPLTELNAGNVRTENMDPWNGESARPPAKALASCWAAVEYQGLLALCWGLALTMYSCPPFAPSESNPA